MLCDYGCGNDAIYVFKNGKMCCSKNSSSCIAVRQKNSEKLKFLYKTGEKTLVFDVVLRKKSHLSRIKNLMQQPFEFLSYSVRYNCILSEQNNKCLFCEIQDWMGKPIKLHLDHIDGNRTNNKRENLRLLCPNCHSQTETYCGRNVNNGKTKVTNEELRIVYNETKSIRKTLITVGLSPKGANYQRMYKLIELWNGNIPDA